ncbi:MAG TPA: glycosyltransferase family 39 protein [Candidatus Paceibacterota bacterium]
MIPILLVVIFISTYKLTESPRTWYDDGLFMQVARNFAHFGVFGVQSSPGELDESIAGYVTTGYSVTYPIGLVFKFFGVGLLQARIPMVVFILLLLVVVFFLIYRLFGYKHAIVSTLLLASFAPVYGNGKLVLGEVPGMFFLVLFLLLLNRIEEVSHKKIVPSILLGLVGGLVVVTKPIFILLIPAVLICIWLRRKKINFTGNNIFFIGLFFLILVLLFFVTYFGEKDSVFGVLSFYGNNYSAGLGDILAAIPNNLERFFKETTPGYFALTMLFWLCSYLLRIRKKQAIGLAENVAILFAILIAIAYLKTPGWYRYLFPGQVLALIFSPSAFSRVYDFVNNKLLRSAAPQFFWSIIFAVIIAFQFYQIGFSSWVAGDYKSTRSKELREYLGNLDKNKSIFVYEAAEAVTFLQSDNYYQFFHITGDRYLGDREFLTSGIPDEVIISSKSMNSGREFLKKYKLKTKLYRDLYFVFEKK